MYGGCVKFNSVQSSAASKSNWTVSSEVYLRRRGRHMHPCPPPLATPTLHQPSVQ